MLTIPETLTPTPQDVRKLRTSLHMSRSTFARLAGATERTIANWETDSAGKPRPMSGAHIVQLYRICQALRELVPRDEIGPWFEKPNPAFNGLKPLEVIERGEVDRIWNMIFELRAGNHA